MKKNILLIPALLAFGLNVWAQSTSITVNSEATLKSALENSSYNYIHLGAGIVLQERLVVNLGNREVTLYMDGHSISRNTNGQVIYLTSGTLQIECHSGDYTSGSIISGGHYDNGGGVHVCSGATLKLKGITIQNCQANQNGGAIYNEGTVEIMESSFRTTIQNCTAGINGGGIYNDGGTLSVSTCDISGCRAPSDHAGAIWNKGPLTVTNCTFTDNTARDVGGIYNAANGSGIVNINNCTFTSNSSTNGCGAIGNASNASAMTITGSSISSCTASTNGGGIWNGSTLTLNNVTIENCEARNTGSEQGRGGAIYNYNGALTIDGGTFQNNTSRDGGAIYNNYSNSTTNTTLTINSGTFTGNSSNTNGGAVSNRGIIYVYGGTFTGNSSSANGGGIYTDGYLWMGGNPVIKDNIGNTGTTNRANNLYLVDNDDGAIHLNASFTEGARIGLTPENVSRTLTFGYKTLNPDTSPDVFFFSDNHYGVQLSGNEVVLNTGALVEAANYIDADGIEKTAWSCNWLSNFSDGATLSSGWYIVNANRTFNSRITVDGDVKFILADDKTLTANNGIAVNENKTLTIYGQSGQTGRLDATVTDDQLVLCAAIGGTYPSNTGTITINGGIVTAQSGELAAGIGGSADKNGGNIIINGGTVSATGGAHGAGIGSSGHVNGGTITINGGSITAQGGVAAAGIGGGPTGNGGNITINGGTITAEGGIGNGVECVGGSITINGGVINATDGYYTAGIGNTDANITLNWTNYSDRYTSSNYVGTVTVATGKSFASTDGSITGLSGTVSDNSMLAGKTFIPADFALPYFDLNGETQYVGAIPITASTSTLSDGWYAVTSTMTNCNRIQAEGNVNIILCDGATMTNSKGIETFDNKSLTFWGQSEGTGTWEVTKPDEYEDGIGNSLGSGYISVNGGIIRSQGADNRYGIRGQSITLRGGSVWANNYGSNVTLERFFSSSNTVYDPDVYSTGFDNKTLTATGKVFHTEGAWSNTDNWYKGELPGRDDYVIIRASVTIPAGCVAQAYKAILDNNATLTIADGGQLIYTYYNTINYTYDQFLLATVEKNIIGTGADDWENASNGWYFIAAPMYYDLDPADVTNMLTANDASLVTETNTEGNSYDLYKYVADNMVGGESKPWYNYHQHAFDIKKEVGYLYANANTQTLQFVGRVNPYRDANNYNVVTLEKTGWNLIGNPFTCKVTVNHAFAELNNGSAVDYKVSGNTIMPCAGIAVYGNAGDAVTFTMVEPDQALAPSNASLNIAVAQQVTDRAPASTIDNAIVSFNEGSALPKFHFMEQAANIYFPKANEEYAVVGSNGQGEMPLNFKATKNGTYTITVNPEGVEMAYLHLIDNMTSADIDLLALRPHSTSSGTEAQGPASYTFTAKTTDYESRFRLVFSTNDEDGPSTSSGTFAYISNGNIIINGEGTLQVIDVMGRIIVSGDAMNRVSTGGMVPGVYVLRLINGDNIKTQKIVIE